MNTMRRWKTLLIAGLGIVVTGLALASVAYLRHEHADGESWWPGISTFLILVGSAILYVGIAGAHSQAKRRRDRDDARPGLNSRQVIATYAGGAAILALVLFPPWSGECMERVLPPPPDGTFAVHDVRHGQGHHFLLGSRDQIARWHGSWRKDRGRYPGWPWSSASKRPEVDTARLTLYVAAALALTVAAVLVLKDRKPKT